MADRLTKADVNALGKIFAAEINGLLPFQSRAQIYLDLCDRGLAEPMTRRLGSGPFAVIVRGFQLTHAGRLRLCVSSVPKRLRTTKGAEQETKG